MGIHYQPAVLIAQRLMGHEYHRAAEVLLRFAIEDSPHYAIAYGLMARIRAEYGDAGGTEMYARAALERERSDPIRQHLLAWALIRQGQQEEAAEAHAAGLEQGNVLIWQRDMYEAYRLRAEGDSLGAYAFVDSAWSRVQTQLGRATLDSARVVEFGLEPLIGSAEMGSARKP